MSLQLIRDLKMKIKQIKTVYYSIGMVMVFMVLIISGCDREAADDIHVDQNNHKESINDQPAKKPKPPKVDIHTAVISGDINAIQQHISAGTNINQKDPFGGSSPLISAALFNQPEIVTLLLDAGANIDFKIMTDQRLCMSLRFFVARKSLNYFSIGERINRF